MTCSIAEAVSALLRDIPDYRLDASICQIVAELSRVRDSRIAASLKLKPTLRGRKVAKTLGFSESATLPIDSF